MDEWTWRAERQFDGMPGMWHLAIQTSPDDEKVTTLCGMHILPGFEGSEPGTADRCGACTTKHQQAD
jgi:hypothetical protein